MRKATLKLKMYAGNVNVINNDSNIEKVLLRSMFWFSVLLAVLYVVFLGNMVFNIVERRTLESEAYTLSNQVGNLELAYLSTSGKIDLNLSHTLGFQETKANFATRPSLGFVSKSNGNEI